MSNAPMSYFNFHRYISNLQKQSDWIDNLYKCNIDGIADKIIKPVFLNPHTISFRSFSISNKFFATSLLL